MLDRFQYLKYALSLVLVFIGMKVLADKGMLQAGNWVEPYNKGLGDWLHQHAFHISPAVSLAITLGTLLAGGLFSLYKTGLGGAEEKDVSVTSFSAFPSLLTWRRKKPGGKKAGKRAAE
jgi:predicted tellurium resistance membrane protein TerC